MCGASYAQSLEYNYILAQPCLPVPKSLVSKLRVRDLCVNSDQHAHKRRLAAVCRLAQATYASGLLHHARCQDWLHLQLQLSLPAASGGGEAVGSWQDQLRLICPVGRRPPRGRPHPALG